MSRLRLRLPDGSSRAHDGGVSPREAFAAIDLGLGEEAVAARVDGVLVDVTRSVGDDSGPSEIEVELVAASSPEGREVLRHSTSHVLAQAVLGLYPGARYAIGPPIADGFYYDFELPDGLRLSEEDLPRIEDRMRDIVAAGQPFARQELDRQSALRIFADQPYKTEIIERAEPEEGAGDVVVSVYRNPGRGESGHGESGFVDLCRGPHVPSTAQLGAFRLTKVAGAYWRGDERRPMLQRVYGTAWESKEALEAHLHRLVEAERRDHRRLGMELDLFSFPDELGAGLAVWHPKGATTRKVIEDFSRSEHERSGYRFVYSPHLARSGLWETSGHLDFYAEAMYPAMELEGARYYPKPMNCPFHVLVYRHRTRSYRELPLRLFELGTVYRYERSGVLHGLLRARGFTQDDSHIFCEPRQLVPELKSLLDFVLRMLRTFGFESFEAEVATRPAGKSVGSDEDWALATEALIEAIDVSGLVYRVAEGEGAFYGPKIDVHLDDAIGRRWQVSTLQVDFQLPQRFELSYVGADNAPHRPIMIHRALFGSVERFFGILVEHYAGAFPTWLAPVQCVVLPVAERHEEHASAVAARLEGAGLRVEVWAATSETLGSRVRRGKTDKVPYLLVVGDEDVSAGTVGRNTRGSARAERGVSLEDFLEQVREEVDGRCSSPSGPAPTASSPPASTR